MIQGFYELGKVFLIFQLRYMLSVLTCGIRTENYLKYLGPDYLMGQLNEIDLNEI